MASGARRLIAGNWKMNGLKADSLKLVGDLAERAKKRGKPSPEIAVCPPATLLADVGKALAGSPIKLGAQDCHTKVSGAHTGDISAAMLKDQGCTYVIVGHSERRTDHGESSALVRSKAEAAYAAGLGAIICIGETEAQRDAGQTLDVIKDQLAGSVPDGATPANTVVAYEPVWAIGTGRTPTTDQVAEVHAFMRKELIAKRADLADVTLLYGGSVKGSNAKELLAVPNVEGALVGGAALKADDFWQIIEGSP